MNLEPRLHGLFDPALPLAAQVLDAPTSASRASGDEIGAIVAGRPHFASEATGESSAAIVLALYRAHGVQAFDRIEGTFAIAIVDARRREVILAIDRLGIETLCYGVAGSRLAFARDASDVAAALRGDRAIGLAHLGGLDPQGLYDYLFFHCIPGPATVYRGVDRLLPGHALRFANGTATLIPYWSPRYDERDRPTSDALERAFVDTVRDAVARSVDGAAKPGAFLSGGTDSSTIAGMLGQVTGKPAPTYSIGFDAEGFDEMQYARIAAKRFGTDHHEYYITPRDLVDSIPRIAAAYDQPFGNSSVLPTYYCARMARADGVDRMLGGDGGDELFGGNSRYAKQRVFHWFERAPAPVRGLMRGALAPSAWEAVPVAKKARSYVQQASVPMPDRLHTYNLLERIGVETIFDRAFLAEVDTGRPMRTMREWYARTDAATLINRMLAFDLKYTLTDNDLPKVVTACRVADVDVAFPFLDDPVLRFAESLAPELKLKGFQLRWFFKHALRDFLPPEILTKTKHGFGLPFGIWLGRDAGLSELAFASLDALKGRGIVRVDFVDRLRTDLLSDHATYYGELVWVLMMLEQWIATHPAGVEAVGA